MCLNTNKSEPQNLKPKEGNFQVSSLLSSSFVGPTNLGQVLLCYSVVGLRDEIWDWGRGGKKKSNLV